MEQEASTMPAADISPAPNGGEEVFTTQRSYQVMLPEAESQEVVIEMRKSEIRRIRNKIERLEHSSQLLQNLSLAFGMLALGMTASALANGVPLASNAGTLSYIVALPIAILLLACHIALRHVHHERARDIRDDVLDLLPDPDHLVDKAK